MARRNRRPQRKWKKLRSTYSIASKALTIAKGVKSLLNVEIKKHDRNYSYEVPNSPNYQLMVDIGQGDKSDNRDGSSIRVKYLNFKGNLKLHSSATSSQVRFILFIDKDSRSLIPAHGELVDVTEGANYMNALRRTDNLQRFVVLKDWTQTVTTARPWTQVSFYKKLSLPVKYEKDDGGNTIGAIRSNALILWVVSNEASAKPHLQYSSRTGYIDN